MNNKWTWTLFSFLFYGAQGFCLNGMYDIGFGAPSKAVGGAAVAYPQDTLSGLTNPANLAAVGSRIDLYAEYCRGTRTGQIFHNAFPYTDANVKVDLSRNKNVIGGEAGIAFSFLEDRFAMGLLAAPQAAGIITWNHQDPFTPFPDQDFHLNVIYASFTPTFSGEVWNSDVLGKHYLGVGVDLTPALIKVAGLKGLKVQSSFLGGTVDPDHVTNNGYDWAFGWAIRIGWLAQIRNWISLGIAYKTKTYMGRFDKYRGLITPHGRADLPATLYGGIALKPFLQTTIVFDVGAIFNGDVNTFANPVFNTAKQNNHGASDGAGFWWKSQTVYKVGVCQQITQNITIRAGYNYGQLPWRENRDDVTLGAWYLPSTIRHHLTMGGSLGAKGGILTATFIYGFKHRIQGPISDYLGGGKATATTDLYQLEIGLSKVW